MATVLAGLWLAVILFHWTWLGILSGILLSGWKRSYSYASSLCLLWAQASIANTIAQYTTFMLLNWALFMVRTLAIIFLLVKCFISNWLFLSRVFQGLKAARLTVISISVCALSLCIMHFGSLYLCICIISNISVDRSLQKFPKIKALEGLSTFFKWGINIGVLQS